MINKIEIDTKTFIRFWLVVIGFLLAGLAIWSAREALFVVMISAFFALALNQPVSAITRMLPGSKKNRAGATAVAYTLIVALIGLFFWFVVPVMVEQTSRFANNLPSIVDDLSSQYSVVEEFFYEHNLNTYIDQAVESLQDSVADASRNIGGAVFSGINTLINGIFTLFMILVMTFLMLIEGPNAIEKVWGFYKDKKMMKRHQKVAHDMYNSVSSYVNGQLFVSLIDGTCAALVTLILSLFFAEIGTNLAIPVGVIVSIIGLIPMFGATIAGALSALILSFNVPIAGVIFLAYFVVYQQVENNIISPIVQSKTNKLSALTVIISLSIGIYTLGILGALISIPVASCVKILFKQYFPDTNSTPKTKKTAKS